MAVSPPIIGSIDSGESRKVGSCGVVTGLPVTINTSGKFLLRSGQRASAYADLLAEDLHFDIAAGRGCIYGGGDFAQHPT
jgi:hypothetical protein